MKLRFDESKIQYWADRYKPRGRIAELESEFRALKPEVQKRSYLNKGELYKVAYWKSWRRADLVERNDDNYIKEITHCAFNATSDRTRIVVLTCLDGIGLPTASAILHLFHKDPYPIIDFRALWSIGIETYRDSYAFWQEYVDFCRYIAIRNDVDMRTLDQALWQYSKEKQS